MEKKKYTQEDIKKFKDYLSDIQTEIENGNNHPFEDKELLKNIKETLITWKVYNNLGKAISDLWTNRDFVKIMTGFEDWKTFHQESFKKSVKSLKYIFKRHHTPIPHDWERVFFDWYLLKHPDLEKTPLHLIPPIDETEIFNWAKEYSENFTFQSLEKVEAYKNLPHVLCLLDDLGILDLIEEKFKTKHYKGKARETDKAKLISTILGIEDPQKIRYAIKNSDYLSDKAKQNAVNTLKTLGLEPSKFSD